MSEERVEKGENDIKELLNLLRETLIELRSIADQLGNPIVPPRVQPEREEVPKVEKTNKEKEVSEQIKVGTERTSIEELKSSTPTRGEELKSTPLHFSKGLEGDSGRLLKLARLIYELSDRVPPEYFSKLVEFIGNLGLANKEQVEALKSLVEIVKMGNEYGLSLEEGLALLALMLRELGIEDKDIVNEVLKRVVRKQGAERWESQQQ